MTEQTKAVLITGASTGIGAACALHLDHLGYRVYAGVRRAEDGTSLAAKSSNRLQPILLDVTDSQAIDKAKVQLDSELGVGGLAGLVNNAGVVIAGPLETLPVAALRQQLEINVIGQLAVTQACLPLLRIGSGRIINMSSIAGRTSMPALGAYCASKFALEALSDALRLEVQGWGIGVVVIEPGAIDTPIWNKSMAYAEVLEAQVADDLRSLYSQFISNLRSQVAHSTRRAIPASVVAETVALALSTEHPRTRYLVGKDAKVYAVLAKLLPDRWRDRLMSSLLKLPRKKRRTATR